MNAQTPLECCENASHYSVDIELEMGQVSAGIVANGNVYGHSHGYTAKTEKRERNTNRG